MYARWIIIALLGISVHAGHKRVIIKVPQRTRHVYHHQVKKVPVYVLLPTNKKSSILEEFEDATKQLGCKVPTQMPTRLPRYPYPGQYTTQKNIYHWPTWKEDNVESDFRRDSFEPELSDGAHLPDSNNNQFTTETEYGSNHAVWYTSNQGSRRFMGNVKNITPIMYSAQSNTFFPDKDHQSPALSFQYKIQH